MKPLVYVAGPYSHPDPVLNTRRAVAIGDELDRLGCAVIIPHLNLVWHLISPQPIEQWYRRDLDVLEHCQALIRFDGASEGADREVARADELGLLVAYSTDDRLLAALIREWLS